MEIKSFDTILTEICDNFDSLISPKKISRSNTNIIYLMFKAISKGFEVINNICVTLSSKFDPSNCSEEDLNSVSAIVGTEKLAGSASGLEIVVKNTASDPRTFLRGFYYYEFDEDTTFVFEAYETVTIQPDESVSYFAFSENLGSYPVTAQTGITVLPRDGQIVSVDLEYSCYDNSGLLGTKDETNVEFRKRILTDTTRQDSLVELQTTLRNLPYLYDCSIFFNNDTDPLEFDGISIPSFYMAIFYSGAPRTEIAEIVASNSIFPTVQTNDSVALDYENQVFTNGKYTVHIIPYKRTNYKVKITYKYNATYVAYSVAEATIKKHLETVFRGHLHSDYITEADIFNSLNSMEMANVTFLNVDLYNESNTPVEYVSIPKSRIPYLLEVLPFEKVVING